ncbi:MAG TPA: hypothetical protein VEC96_12680 [Anaerolineae bacterium]|jgi:hypothetical protein|nr:hypothetical protein [Anaerolineae bacterium]HXW01521.1 hypothetical protein [Anaerolineae bacterium]
MADQSKARQIEQKIRQTLEKLGEALDEWLKKRQLQPQPIPIPLDRPYRKKINN